MCECEGKADWQCVSRCSVSPSLSSFELSGLYTDPRSRLPYQGTSFTSVAARLGYS